jgi:hypothetical protein
MDLPQENVSDEAGLVFIFFILNGYQKSIKVPGLKTIEFNFGFDARI